MDEMDKVDRLGFLIWRGKNFRREFPRCDCWHSYTYVRAVSSRSTVCLPGEWSNASFLKLVSMGLVSPTGWRLATTTFLFDISTNNDKFPYLIMHEMLARSCEVGIFLHGTRTRSTLFRVGIEWEQEIRHGFHLFKITLTHQQVSFFCDIAPFFLILCAGLALERTHFNSFSTNLKQDRKHLSQTHTTSNPMRTGKNSKNTVTSLSEQVLSPLVKPKPQGIRCWGKFFLCLRHRPEISIQIMTPTLLLVLHYSWREIHWRNLEWEKYSQ